LSVLLICGAHDRQSSHFECQAHGIVGCVVRTFALCPLVSIIACSSSLYIYIFRIRFGSTLYPIIIVADPPCYRLESPHGIAGMYTAWHGTAVAQAPLYGLDPSRYSDPEQTWGRNTGWGRGQPAGTCRGQQSRAEGGGQDFQRSTSRLSLDDCHEIQRRPLKRHARQNAHQRWMPTNKTRVGHLARHGSRGSCP